MRISIVAVLMVACGQVMPAGDAGVALGEDAGVVGDAGVVEDAGLIEDAGVVEDAGQVHPGYLANCGSLFAARIVEKQLELDAGFPEDCDAPLLDGIGALNSRNLAPLCVAGESANACRERVYRTPPPLQQLERGCAPTTGCMKAKWVAACVDGTDTCAVPDAVCIDGTRPLVYVEPATSAPVDANRWIIHLGGGGGPCQGAQCWANYRYQVENVFRRSLSTLHPDFLVNSTEQGTGLMLGVPDAGNPMAAFNRVKWERCSSWSTDGIETVPFGDGAPAGIPDVSGPVVTRTSTTQVWHKGLPMARALFRSLTTLEGRDLDGDGVPDLPSLADATSVYLAGSSDAAAGLTWGADALAAELRAIAGPGVEVRILFDGYFPPGLENEQRYQAGAPAGFNVFANTYNTGDVCVLPDNGDGVANETCSNRHLLPGTSQAIADTTLADFLTRQGVAGDASCLAAHGAGAWQCFDPQHVLNHHLGTPFTVVSDREDPVIGASRGYIADDSTYRWATPEVYGRRLLDQAHDVGSFWATAAREEGAGAGARLMLRKERRGMAPWQAANHVHFDSNMKMRWRMSKCTARNQPPLLTVSIAELVAGTAPEAFIVEDAARAGAGPYWVTGDDCSAAPE